MPEFIINAACVYVGDQMAVLCRLIRKLVASSPPGQMEGFWRASQAELLCS
jgi:hypothetical protein